MLSDNWPVLIAMAEHYRFQCVSLKNLISLMQILLYGYYLENGYDKNSKLQIIKRGIFFVFYRTCLKVSKNFA